MNSSDESIRSAICSVPARLIRDEPMVSSNARLLRTGVSINVTQPYSGSRPEPTVTDCRLGTMVRCRQRTCVRRAHSFYCQKHGIRSGSHWISGPRLCVECEQYWSTRAGDPRAPGTDGALPSCRSSRQLKPTPSSDLSTKLLGFQPLN